MPALRIIGNRQNRRLMNQRLAWSGQQDLNLRPGVPKTLFVGLARASKAIIRLQIPTKSPIPVVSGRRLATLGVATYLPMWFPATP